ncbi:MAG: hypothetical protein U1F34_09235 [Gammaproteobacteria bacterium]
MIEILLAGTGMFAAALLAQAVTWRLVVIQGEMRILALIFLAIPTVVHVLLWKAGAIAALDALLIYVLYLSITCAYIQTYPALREEIPSFRILRAIAASGAKGLTEGEIIAQIQDARLFGQKIDDLKNDGLIKVDSQGLMMLTPSGRSLATMFYRYRRLLGVGQGDG